MGTSDQADRDPASMPRSRRSVLRASALAGGTAVAAGLAPWGSTSAQPALPDAIVALMNKPRYASATWNLFVTDVETGEAVYTLRPDQLAFTGSVRKLFSVGLALRQLGAGHRFTTPVYRRGEVDRRGVLHGDLVLVAAGDLTFGGRVTAGDGIAFTDFDHNDANNLGTAILTPQDPLRGVNSFAQQIRAAGIRSLAGDVIVDTRLFESFRVPNGNLLITPIMVNENMVDVTVTPTVPGRAASIDWRPKTDAFTVTGSVNTVAAGMPDTVTLSGDGLATCIGIPGCSGAISGDIPVGYKAPLSGRPTLVQTFRIEEPAAFARTALIDALKRAGVAFAAPVVAENRARSLPPFDSYPTDTRVAEFISPPYAEYAKLILKVSLNLGANLSLMLYGLTQRRRTIDGALAAEQTALVNFFSIPADSFHFPTNGSGSPDSQASPRAVVQLLTAMGRSEVAAPYRASLPVLGVDGSLASSGVNLPARGHVFAKTGTTILGGALKAQNLAGYIDAKSGRRLAFALFVNDAGPITAISDVTEVFDDQAAITNAIYELA